jgi:hypothetical protein
VRLLEFDFVDIVENCAFAQRLQCWLGCPFIYDHHNETNAMPKQHRALLHRELTPDALDLLDARSSLDLRLWAQIAAYRLPDRDVLRLRERTVLANVARYSVLMAY